MTGRQGPSERYAPVGAILPTATAAGPFRALLATDGYAAPKAPVGITCPTFL